MQKGLGYVHSMWFFKRKKQFIPRSMVSIRMEAIGGQGANSAGKILAEAAVLKAGFSGNHFSSFGSEKRGAPVRSFVRFSPAKQVIRSASFVRYPDVLLVFHENLLRTHTEIFDGVGVETDLIVNSSLAPGRLRVPSGVSFRNVYTIDATEVALRVGCGLNAVMLGAVVEAVPEVKADDIRQTLSEFFSKLPAEAVSRNQTGFSEGMKRLRSVKFSSKQASEKLVAAALPEIGYMNAPLGGIIANPGNTVLKDNSASRKGIAPRLNRELCFNCGLCDMVCPDFCFVWDSSGPKLQGIDYQYCKGCQKCVVACPVDALTPVLESSIPESDRQYHVFPEANRDAVRARWQNADWSKLASEISPEMRMLTLQTELLDHRSYIRPDLSHIKKPEVKE